MLKPESHRVVFEIADWRNILVIDHFGVVVKSIEQGIQDWVESFGYRQMTTPIINARQKVEVVFLEKKNSTMVKLIRPIDETSPVFRFAMRGGGFHHICFRCEDMDATIDKLKDSKLRLITKPEPGKAFSNNNIAFLYGHQGLNIELIDTIVKEGFLE